jgi:outer membrane protein TolC
MSTDKYKTKSIVSYLLSSAAIVGVLTQGSVAIAGQALSLHQVLDKSDTSPKVERARSFSEEVSWKKVETYSGFLPSLTANGTYLFDKKYVMTDINLGSPLEIPQIIPTTSYGLTAQWLLFDGFANFDRFSAAKDFEAAGKKEYSWARFQQERETILLFYRALAARSLQKVTEQNVKTFEDHLSDARLLKKTGISTNFDVLRVEVQVSEAKSEFMSASDLVQMSVLRLGESLGEDYSQVELAGEMPVLSPELLKSLKDKDIAGREDLEALRLRRNGLEQNVDSTGKHWVPKVSAFGQYLKYNSKNDRFEDNNAFRDAYSVGLQATWNLFEGFSSVAKNHEAVEQRYQAEKTLMMGELKATNDTEFWKKKYIYFCNVFQSRQSDIQKATESVRLAKEGRKVGVRTNTDLLDAELELFRAQASGVNAQIGAIEALISLELATGQKIYSF